MLDLNKVKKRHTLLHYIIVTLLVTSRNLALAIIYAGIGFLGYWLYFLLLSPLNIIVAGVLVSIGTSLFLIQVWEIWVALTSRDYNLTHCPFCRPSRDPKKILSAHNGRVE